MKYSSSFTKRVTIGSLVVLGIFIYSPVPAANAQVNRGNGSTELDERFDTSFAIEYSESCVSGGCHETDTQLIEEHANSFMTHVMIKCNACHGTHTAEDVGGEKPNLTGYYPGIGSSGYTVGDDLCIACHTATLERKRHPRNHWACAECHLPHRFSK